MTRLALVIDSSIAGLHLPSRRAYRNETNIRERANRKLILSTANADNASRSLLGPVPVRRAVDSHNISASRSRRRVAVIRHSGLVKYSLCSLPLSFNSVQRLPTAAANWHRSQCPYSTYRATSLVSYFQAVCHWVRVFSFCARQIRLNRRFQNRLFLSSGLTDGCNLH